MSAAPYVIACIATIVFIAMSKRIEDLKAERDDWRESAEKLERSRNFYRATCDLSLGQQLALQSQLLEAELAFTLEATEHEATKQALWDAGRECATHANHLTAVMDAMAEGKPLRLAKGGER